MEDTGIDQAPNPFSVFAHPKKQQSRSSVKWPVKSAWLLLCVGVFGAVQLSQSGWIRSLGFDGLEGQERIEKEEQVAEFQPGIGGSLQPLVMALFDHEEGIRAAAAGRIEREWASWRTLPASEMHGRQTRLAEELAASRMREVPTAEFPEFRRLVEKLAENVSWTDDSGNSTASAMFLQLLSTVPATEKLAGESRSTNSQNPRHSAIEMPNQVASSWTEWPRSSTAPRIYKPGARVARFSTVQSPPILSQTAPGRSQAVHEPTESRSTAHDAIQTLLDQLASPSRIVRRRALEELSQCSDPRVRDALARALASEPDPGIANAIRAVLNDDVALAKGNSPPLRAE